MPLRHRWNRARWQARHWLSRQFGRFADFVDTWRGGVLRPWALRLPVVGWRKARRQLVQRHVRRFGRPPDLVRPTRLNERIVQRMIFDRDPWLRITCDKLATRRLVGRVAGAEYALPLLGEWDRADRIDWDRLPDSFVLKPNNMSGQVQVVTDKKKADLARLTREASRWLAKDFFDEGLEWGYLNTPNRVLAEPRLRSRDGGTLIEVNILTFSGQPEVFEVLTGAKRTARRCSAWYGPQGERLAIRARAEPAEDVLDPAAMDRLRSEFTAHREALADLAHRLGRLFAFMRIDIWITDDGLKVAELTPYPARGTTKYLPEDWDRRLGTLFADHVRADREQVYRRRSGWPFDIPGPSTPRQG